MLEIMIVEAPIRDLALQHLRTRIVLIAALVALFFAASAAHPRPAIAGGVHFDPESPSGKEYALPLSQARNEAAGKTGVSENGTVEPAPLFGEGISGSGGSPGSGAHASTASGRGGRKHGMTTAKARAGDTVGASKALPGKSTAITIPAVSSYPTASAILWAALVLLVGIGIGLGLRALGRGRPRAI